MSTKGYPPYSEIAKKALGRVGQNQARINATLDEIEHIHALRTKITSTLKECTSGGGGTDDRRADATVRLMELETRLKRQVESYAQLTEVTISTINWLRSDTQREVMYRRYILSKTFPKIAEELDMDVDSIYHIHGRALRNIGRMLTEHPTKQD